MFYQLFRGFITQFNQNYNEVKYIMLDFVLDKMSWLFEAAIDVLTCEL